MSTDKLPSYYAEGIELPPSYASAVEKRTLKPTTALQNDRYNREYTVGAHSFLVQAGPSAEPVLPGPWTTYINPEGMPYHYNTESRIITDNDIRNPNILAAISMFFQGILEAIVKNNMTFEEDCDLCLQLDSNSDSCHYYLVDHSRKTLFWLEGIESEDLGLPYAATMSQLRWAREEEYWAHIEFFPFRTLNIACAASELSRILMFGCGDQMTSSGSTFPYDANQCKEFLTLLRNSPQEGQEFTWLVARLWTFIARHRFATYYGEPHARLNRDQRRLGPRIVRCPFIIRALSAMLFAAPEQLAAEMDLLYIDELVYTTDWRKFIKARMSDWQQSSTYAIATLIAHLLAVQVTEDSMSHAVGLVGSIMSAGSLITTTGLLQRYSGAESLHATNAIQHIGDLDHPKLGFHLPATVFSLPRAMQTWSLLIFPVQIILAAIAMDNSCSLLVICAVGFVIMCILLATRVTLASNYRQHDEGSSWWGKLLPGCHHLRDSDPDASPV